VTRYRRRLDYILAELVTAPFEKLDPVVVEVLRVGLYEILELGLDDHAIFEHVELVKQMLGVPAIAGLLNGRGMRDPCGVCALRESTKFRFAARCSTQNLKLEEQELEGGTRSRTRAFERSRAFGCAATSAFEVFVSLNSLGA
jgi:NusB family